ncbi:MAG: hypothetical protein HYZ48_04330, partial [Chlamydiales bacterium]|nr:hypothetical protein [Chlamydiales bacterium]
MSKIESNLSNAERVFNPGADVPSTPCNQSFHPSLDSSIRSAQSAEKRSFCTSVSQDLHKVANTVSNAVRALFDNAVHLFRKIFDKQDYIPALLRDGRLRLQELGERDRSNPHFVRAAIEHDLGALQFATSQAIRILLAENGSLLEHAGNGPQANPEIVRIAIGQNLAALAFASNEALRVLLAEDGLRLEHAGNAARTNEEIVRIAI